MNLAQCLLCAALVLFASRRDAASFLVDTNGAAARRTFRNELAVFLSCVPAREARDPFRDSVSS